MIKLNRFCPECKKPVDWISQVKQWDKMYGNDWNGEAVVMIICENCSSYVMEIDLVEASDGEEIESPALKQKVKMPKVKRSKKVDVYKPKLA